MHEKDFDEHVVVAVDISIERGRLDGSLESRFFERFAPCGFARANLFDNVSLGDHPPATPARSDEKHFRFSLADPVRDDAGVGQLFFRLGSFWQNTLSGDSSLRSAT